MCWSWLAPLSGFANARLAGEDLDLKRLYLTTSDYGLDILFFWVRGCHDGLSSRDVPFRELYIHALVGMPAPEMSKTKGNVSTLVTGIGTDAVRFALASRCAGTVYALSEKGGSYRAFAIKSGMRAGS